MHGLPVGDLERLVPVCPLSLDGNVLDIAGVIPISTGGLSQLG